MLTSWQYPQTYILSLVSTFTSNHTFRQAQGKSRGSSLTRVLLNCFGCRLLQGLFLRFLNILLIESSVNVFFQINKWCLAFFESSDTPKNCPGNDIRMTYSLTALNENHDRFNSCHVSLSCWSKSTPVGSQTASFGASSSSSSPSPPPSCPTRWLLEGGCSLSVSNFWTCCSSHDHPH